MIDALIDLNASLNRLGTKLYIFYGKQHTVLNDILKADTDIDAVFVNRDYTPYAIKRERKTKSSNRKGKLCI